MVSTSKVRSVPDPAGIVAPVKLKPITLLPPVETVKPASAAAPPAAPPELAAAPPRAATAPPELVGRT